MKYKRILSTIVFLCLATIVFNCSVKANDIADSIRMQMKHLTGEHLLQAHSNLCRLAAGEDNLDNELATLRAYIKEANLQNDVEAEGQARSMQMMCFYNYDMVDSLKNALPNNLAFMGQHALWDHYYNSWNTLVELYIYDDNLQTALQEANKMYADAKKKNSNYGIGVSAYCMGSKPMRDTLELYTYLKVDEKEMRSPNLPDMDSGKSYTFNLTVGKEKLEIESVTVADWSNQEIITGGEAGEFE